MNLVEFQRRKKIANLSQQDLDQVLRNRGGNVFIVKESPGLLVLSTKEIIKCAKYYYQPLEKKPSLPKSNDGAECGRTHEALGITDTGIFSCRLCHSRCIMMHEDKRIKRLYKK